jgi:mRNA (guanine-N7-)-methyltransferase
MDNYVREHYDAAKASTRRERAEGPAAPLKIYHNTVKRHLISTFASGAGSLLDIACGRGGDLHKWDSAQVQHVHGVDISPCEIKEAQRRYTSGNWKHVRCDFHISSTLATKDWYFKQYDVVSCMFALHYFCGSEQALEHILRNVSASLKPGGYFIGAVPDGARILHPVSEPMLNIQPLWSGPVRPFGCAYLCDIADTVTSGGSIEYRVDEDALIATAAKYELQPVLTYGEGFLHRGTKLFHHFNPPFTTEDGSLERASKLFATFVFTKRKQTINEI